MWGPCFWRVSQRSSPKKNLQPCLGCRLSLFARGGEPTNSRCAIFTGISRTQALPHPIFRIPASQRPKGAELKRLTSRFSLGPTSWKIMAGFPKVRMLELELFQCLNRQLGYAGRLGVVAIELLLPARGSQTVGANCDQALWFCPFGFQSVMPTLLSPRGYGARGDHAAGPLTSKSCFSGFEVSRA